MTDLIALLRRLEWSKDGQCQICGARLVKADSGHAQNCELNHLLVSLEIGDYYEKYKSKIAGAA